MEITKDVRTQIEIFAKEFTGVDEVTLHQLANQTGYMLVLETRNIEGFNRFVAWFKSEVEREDVEVIRALPQEGNPFEDFDKRSAMFFDALHHDFGVATEINDGRISHMKKDYLEGSKLDAI